jgi:hypothetical protein
LAPDRSAVERLLEFSTPSILNGHGIVKVPHHLVEALPDAIRAHEEVERQVIAVCQAPDFSLDAYSAAWRSDAR